MKPNLIITLLLFALAAEATVRTVSNNPTYPAQFDTFVAAQTAAVAGDTIYVYGSPFQYPAISVTKRLVIIGAGYSPNNQYGQPTNIPQISLFRDAGTNDASGTVIMGVICNLVHITGTLTATDITLTRNQLSSINAYSPGHSQGWIIYNNIINGTINGGAGSRTSQSATNMVIANNIISGAIAGFNSNTIIVDHNIFLSSSNLTTLFNVIITNNIFVRTSGDILNNVVLSTFNNNLSNLNTVGPASQYTPTNSFTATYIGSGGGSNSGGGNFVGVEPLFTNVTNFNTYSNTANHRLQNSSPGRNAGTDGTDLGIYGGVYPFSSGGMGTQYDTAPMPPIPQVTAVNIQNATIQPNGTLNVQVQGKVNN
jgi:hypothetical protein